MNNHPVFGGLAGGRNQLLFPSLGFLFAAHGGCRKKRLFSPRHLVVRKQASLCN